MLYRIFCAIFGHRLRFFYRSQYTCHPVYDVVTGDGDEYAPAKCYRCGATVLERFRKNDDDDFDIERVKRLQNNANS